VGAGTSTETGCGGQRPHVEASITYVREKRRCVGVRKGSRVMVTPPMKMEQCSEKSAHTSAAEASPY
jgi:hypothetical protein